MGRPKKERKIILTFCVKKSEYDELMKEKRELEKKVGDLRIPIDSIIKKRLFRG